jgi:hypothetical protein
MAIVRIVPVGDVELVRKENGKRDLLLASGPEFVRFKIAQRLKFFLGEWFLNLREGVPFYAVVLIQNPDLEFVRSLYRRVILSVQEVASVDNITLDWNQETRRLAVTFDAQLVRGGTLAVRQPDPAFVLDFSKAA